MIWKRAFSVLGCLNLLLFLLFGLWFISLPSAAEIQPPSINQNAKVQLAFGEDAINTYLSYAVSERPDLKRFLSFVRVDFSNTWTVDFGVKYGNIINSNLKIGALPVIQNGNLLLRIQSATFGVVKVPPSLVFLILRHVPIPNWIEVNDSKQEIAIDFKSLSATGTTPYTISALNYSAKTRLLTLQVGLSLSSVKH